MATITGPRTTGNITADRRTIDVGSKIGLLEPSSTPLTWLTNRIPSNAVGDPKYAGLEDDSDPRFAATAGAITANAVSVTVAAGQGTYFAQHDLVKVPRTGEVFRVSSVATDTLTVVRAVGGDLVNGTAMNASEELLLIGSASPEADTSKPARSTNLTKLTNYTQIQKKSVDMSGTELATRQTVNPHDWDYQVNKMGIEHAKDWEYAFLFGKASEDLSGSTSRRTTGGVLQFVTTNQTDAGGGFQETELRNAMRPIFRYSSGRKFALMSALAADVINQFSLARLNIVSNSQTIDGLNIQRYQTPAGTIDYVVHPLLEGATYGGYMIVLDTSEISRVYLAGDHGSRDIKFEEDIGPNDYDGRKGQYIGECGLRMGMAKKHGLITNITSYAP